MRRLIASIVIGVLGIACTVNSTDKGDGTSSGGSSSGGSSSGGSSSGGSSSGSTTASSSSGGSSSGGSSSGSAVTPAEAEIDIDGQCSAFVACGGNPQGTYDYTGGCIADVFAGARGACPNLDTSKAVVKVKGSITFSGNALTRNVTLTTSGSIKFPYACAQGQCAAIEAELKNAFDSASCSGSLDCDCTISKVEADTDATTYTIQGSLVTTADGDQYSICEKASDLSYSGKSAGSEQGSFTLKKR